MKQFDLVLKFDDYNYPYASMEEAPHGKYVLAHEAFEENPEYEWSHRYAKWIKKEKDKPTINYLEPSPTLEQTLEAVEHYLKWWREQPASRERSITIGQLGHTKRRLATILCKFKEINSRLENKQKEHNPN